MVFNAHYRIIFAIGLILLGGCAPRLTDDVIEAQVLEELNTWTVGIGEPLSDILIPEKVSVVDRKVEGKRCVAVCVVSMRVKETYAASSAVATVLSLSGLHVGGGEQGEVKEANMRFVFELFEGGWRLTGTEK